MFKITLCGNCYESGEAMVLSYATLPYIFLTEKLFLDFELRLKFPSKFGKLN